MTSEQTRKTRHEWRKNNKAKIRIYMRKWRAKNKTHANKKQKQYNKTYYEKHIEQEKQREFIHYHTKVKKKPLSEAQKQCIREAHEYDKMRDVSSYSHKEGD